MTFEDCLEYLQRNPNGFLATVEGDQPHVRPMTLWLADETGFYFCTSRMKPLMSQLETHPIIEIAFHEPGTPPDIGTILRIAGKIEIVDDMDNRRILYETMPWLKQMGSGTPDSPSIVVFKIARGRFNFWTWENDINPGPWVPFP